MIVNTVFAGGEKAELTVEVEYIPGVDKGSTLNGSADQVHDVHS